MSAASVAATSRPFIFDLRKAPIAEFLAELPKLAGVTPASRLEVRPAPEKVTSGVVSIDALTGGLPRGCLTEICGPASSGRTSLLLAALAAATRRGEVCALVDAGETLDPFSAAAAGIDLGRLLWVRCGEKPSSPHSHRDTEKDFKKDLLKSRSAVAPRGTVPGARAYTNPNKSHYAILDQVLRVTDLLLQSSGFGMIALDLGDISPRVARRIPLASWFRFRRAIENTPTVLLAIEQQPIAGSCSSLLLRLRAASCELGKKKLSAVSSQPLVKPDVCSQCSAHDIWPSHVQLLTTLDVIVELEHTRLERKPPRNPQTFLRTQPAWAVS